MPNRYEVVHPDDDGWEDVDQSQDGSDGRPSCPSTPTSSTPITTSISPKKRPRAIYASGSPRKQFAMGTTTRQRTAGSIASNTDRALSPKPNGISQKSSSQSSSDGKETLDVLQGSSDARSALQDAAASGAFGTLKYIVDVLSFSIIMLKKPIALVVALWMLSLLAAQLSRSIRSTLQPLCIVPGLHKLPLCTADYPLSKQWASQQAPKRADYPALMDIQTMTLEKLLDEAAGGSGFVYEIKRAEIATGDLLTLVRLSDLTTRDRLADTLTHFIDNAKLTGQGLQRLSTQVNGAVDSIMAVNDYALRTIEATNNASPYAISRYLPFGLSPFKSDAVLRETFADAMGVISANMARLIIEAQVSLQRLEDLGQQLSLLYEIISREKTSMSFQRDELLGQLWTFLGGNKRQLRHFSDHLALLNELSMYRKRALAHVVAALQTLQGMSYEMEDLRARVAAPELVGERIPMEVHIQSIKSGLERLDEGRIKAKERSETALRQILGEQPARLN